MSGYEWSSQAGSYGSVVAQATPEARGAFITRTYLHLFGAIVLFAFLEVLWFALGVHVWMIQALSSGRFAMLIFIALFMGTSWLANSWANEPGSKGKQYAGLGLYTVAESLIFLPLIAFASIRSVGPDGEGSNILVRAIVVTLMLFGSLTGVVFVTRKDFSFMRAALYFGGIAAMVIVVASLLFGFSLGAVFSYFMIALACGYILYGTSNVMLHYNTQQHVAAALSLFASVMLLFYYVLRLFLNRRN